MKILGIDPGTATVGWGIIEEVGGAKSYWALGHGGDKPDFHDPACFTARLG